MTPEEVLSHPARVLTRKQREDYFSNGYLAVESLFSPDEVARIRAVVDEFVREEPERERFRRCLRRRAGAFGAGTANASTQAAARAARAVLGGGDRSARRRGRGRRRAGCRVPSLEAQLQVERRA